jgi:hypothetical protein
MWREANTSSGSIPALLIDLCLGVDMLDFFAALMIITGGIACVIFWVALIGAIAIEINDGIRERRAREVMEEGGAENRNP